ncbi:hypothetical protein DFR86_04805 [Acidianus sulfidivorans JP7]|uniref:Uncharacterized protein n=1 Tax=Acidianus sulfidivorans JP7 TaxID=619593 RepID=A0A2U9ILP6_9CREN|nr:hypothetical protein [Acidianus sulfidivorans]AWR96946.1 hypothetical protein DFR86_04805 [Acidianus sulfidivorans JP7]
MKKLSLEEYFLNYLPRLNKDELYLFYLISRDREAKQKLGFSIDKVLFRIKEKNDPLKAIKILLSIREESIFQVKGIRVEKEWLKIMHVLNPVNYVKASKKAVLRYIEQCNTNPDIEKFYDSELPRSVDFKIFMLDIDEKNPDIINELKDIKPRLVITTRRGFHVHVWKDDISNPQKLFKINNIEIKTRNAIEYVPDISQGNFTPEAYKIDSSEEIKQLL